METLFVGQNAIFLPQVESTNSYATALLKNVNLTEGTVIYTTDQTKGRGQRGNNWISGPGLNLAVSYVLRPSFLPIDKLFYMYIISALAVHDVMAEMLSSSQFDIKIKWPNDILVNSKKIAGILNENILHHTTTSATIVGIGLNINQQNFEGVENATSLRVLSGKEHDTTAVLKILHRHLENYYLKLKNKQFEVILKAYYAYFYKIDQVQGFSVDNNIQNFTVKGINEKGLLDLEDTKGTHHHFDIKQIKWV
jgi:BirA family transcriptional regulator, biotin operon repressor / biotin---[acetyl-CoA-carboxylase] ligase